MTGPDSRYTEQELRLILQRAVEMERLGPSLAASAGELAETGSPGALPTPGTS